MPSFWKTTFIAVLLAISTTAFADDGYLSAQTDNAVTQTNTVKTPNKDPLGGFNRASYKFNDFLDTYFLKPIATVYNKIMPRPLNRGIGNVYSNVKTITTTANDFLQGNVYQGSSDAWRFIVNTTAGIGGLFDVASSIGLQPNYEDFGLTLARWGWTDSTYIVLPFFGPSTIRDALAMPVDYYAFSPYSHIDDSRTRNEIYVLGIVNQRAQALQYEELMNQASLDEYVFIKNAYLQKRIGQIAQNRELNDPYMSHDTLADSTSPEAEDFLAAQGVDTSTQSGYHPEDDIAFLSAQQG